MKYNYGDLPKSEIEVNSKRKVKTNRVQSLLDATADLDDYGTDDCVLASELLAKAEKKKVERNQSAIKQEDDEAIRNRISDLINVTKTRCAVFPTLITTYGLADNGYASNIQSVVTLDDLFV